MEMQIPAEGLLSQARLAHVYGKGFMEKVFVIDDCTVVVIVVWYLKVLIIFCVL